MKRKFLNITVIMLAIGLVSCSNSDDSTNPADNGALIREVSNLVMNGTWTISEFIDSGSDETSNFSGFSFTFNSDGSLIAEGGTEIITGEWSITADMEDLDDDSGDDSDKDDIDFNIFFASPTNFSELTEDWHIVSRSDSRIELNHVSGGNGGTDSLIFVKD